MHKIESGHTQNTVVQSGLSMRDASVPELKHTDTNMQIQWYSQMGGGEEGGSRLADTIAVKSGTSRLGAHLNALQQPCIKAGAVDQHIAGFPHQKVGGRAIGCLTGESAVVYARAVLHRDGKAVNSSLEL